MSAVDHGLFGPDSVTWRLHADPTLIVGGLRALFLQSLHPAVVTATLEHSDFRADPWGRLVRTGEYVGTITYGTTAQARRAAARVRGMHRRVPGAGEPDLLLWVHCCEIESFLSTTRRAGLRLSAAETDRYIEEQDMAARLIGAGPGPRSMAGLSDYFTDVWPQLGVTAQAREAAHYVLLPPMPAAVRLATPARPAWAGLAGLAFSLLPRWARRMYALPGLPTTDLAATAAVAALRTGLLAVPAALRDGPHLKAARSRLAAS
ncbi:MAG: oxygenase MpaB family protein [Pseudonocardiales bacterium]